MSTIIRKKEKKKYEHVFSNFFFFLHGFERIGIGTVIMIVIVIVKVIVIVIVGIVFRTYGNEFRSTESAQGVVELNLWK